MSERLTATRAPQAQRGLCDPESVRVFARLGDGAGLTASVFTVTASGETMIPIVRFRVRGSVVTTVFNCK